MRIAAHHAAEYAFGKWETTEGRIGFYDWLKGHPELKQHVGDATKLDALNIIGALVADNLITSSQADSVIDAAITKQMEKMRTP